MEQKIRYQYTYFICPFNIQNYEKYILNLILKENVKLKTFEKGKDLDVYSYFTQKTREYFFPSFNLNKENINAIASMDNKLKASTLSKFTCVNFDYNIEELQGKIGEKEGIFFKIDKIEIMCFSTKIGFVILKTHIEDCEKLSDVIDFNYKFKNINSEFTNLKNYENIKIQTDSFENPKELTELISELTEGNGVEKKLFTHSYVCIDSSSWSKEEEFENIKTDYLKYINVLPSKHSQDVGIEDNTVYSSKYVKMGVSLQSTMLFSSSIENFNYTKLPYQFENEYLYTTIICLYQKELIDNMEELSLENEKQRKQMSNFTKLILHPDITKDEIGCKLYSNLLETMNIEEGINKVKQKYEILYKERNIEKDRKINKILIVFLILSLSMNIINFIAILNLIK